MVERFSEIRNKEVIHVCEGSRLGYVSDCCIELETGRVTAVVIPGPCRFLGLFGRDSDYVVPWCCIRRIGEDIILVRQSGVRGVHLQEWQSEIRRCDPRHVHHESW